MTPKSPVGWAESAFSWSQRQHSSLGFDLFRVILGLMVMRHLFHSLREWSTMGYFADSFHLPYAAWIPAPSEGMYFGLVGLALAAAVGLIVGWRPRTMSVLACLPVTYLFFQNELWYRHNRYFLVLVLFLSCFGPARSLFSPHRAGAAEATTAPVWPAFLVKVQVSLIYLASATSKLLDPAWRGGDVLQKRALMEAIALHLPESWASLLPDAATSATMAVATEYGLAILLWVPATRHLAIWIGILFHGFIEFSAAVATFSYLTAATYFLFSAPTPLCKTLVLPRATGVWRCVAQIVASFDWLAQIQITSAALDRMRYIDKDGREYAGGAAWIALGVNLPVLFPLFYPAHLFVQARRLGRRSIERLGTQVQLSSPSPVWLVLVLAAYLAYSWFANADADYKVTFDDLRFLDFPWFLVIACLVARLFRRDPDYDRLRTKISVTGGGRQ